MCQSGYWRWWCEDAICYHNHRSLPRSINFRPCEDAARRDLDSCGTVRPLEDQNAGRCFAPACCRPRLASLIWDWAEYRNKKLDGGYNDHSRKLGDAILKLLAEHSTKCGFNQEWFEEDRTDAMKDNKLPVNPIWKSGSPFGYRW